MATATNADNSDGTGGSNNGTSTNSGNQSQGSDILNPIQLGKDLAQGAPFSNWFGTLEADTANFANQVLNSLFYGLAAWAGLLMMAWGLYKLFGNAELGALAAAATKVATF